MKKIDKFFIFIFFELIFLTFAFSQAENVPVNHPIYGFLKRMEVKGIIEKYHDAVLPVSRRDAASFLTEIKSKEAELTKVERAILEDYFVEFHYDLSSESDSVYSILNNPLTISNLKELFSEREKYLYHYIDSNTTCFVDGLLTLDARRSTGDTIGDAYAYFARFGGRIHGTVYKKLGYYLEGTNAQFWGSRDVLRRDKYISQAYTLGILNAKNFDFFEGYARYDADILSLQIGRERILWGNGYGDKLILSDNPRVFDFIRADAKYKSLQYTFMHGWLLGRKTNLLYDTLNQFTEPVVSDKYYAAHRLELSFPSLFDIGFQEIAIYSNRSVDLAYLNPVSLIESAQRSREERDNIFWAFDIQTHFIRDVELHADILFDDINFPKWGTSSWENRYAYQIGLLIVDPLMWQNASLAVEYTRIEPYTFSHGRSRDNNYGSLNRFLGHHIGPNAESWFFKIVYLPDKRVIGSLDCEISNKGEDYYDLSGRFINVGGDYLIPHRLVDPDESKLLAGHFVRTFTGHFSLSYQFVNEIFFNLDYRYQKRTSYADNEKSAGNDFDVSILFDF